jgi:hypothetical protein
MQPHGNVTGGFRLLTPATVVDQLPSRPVLSSHVAEKQGVVVQRYRHPPGTIDVPGVRAELLVNHLVGPVLVEELRQGGTHEQRWTGPGQVSFTPSGQRIRRVLKGRPDVVLVYLAPELLKAVAEEVLDLDIDRITLVPGTVAKLGVRSREEVIFGPVFPLR